MICQSMMNVPIISDSNVNGIVNLFSEYEPVSLCKNYLQWKKMVGKRLEKTGASNFLISIGSSFNRGEESRKIITNFPTGWIDCHEKENFVLVDPILKHSKTHVSPLCWRKAKARAKGREAEFWKKREYYGIQCGFSIPFRSFSHNGYICVSFPIKTLLNKTDKNEIFSELFALIPFALEGYMHFDSHAGGTQTVSLSPRESECLKWASCGKTSWEISQILGCSERTINFHCNNASQKLMVSNRRQAVAVAISRGLISI